MKYQLGESVNIPIVREEANFDRACEAAGGHACIKFGVDDSGHFNNVEGAERSTCSIDLEFKSYKAFGGMGGVSHCYEFTARVTSHE